MSASGARSPRGGTHRDSRLLYGVDIGGTKVLLCIVQVLDACTDDDKNSAPQVLHSERFPTPPTTAALLQGIADAVAKFDAWVSGALHAPGADDTPVARLLNRGQLSPAALRAAEAAAPPVGVGVAGMADRAGVLSCSNTPSCHGVDLRAALEHALAKKYPKKSNAATPTVGRVRVENDANCFALAECCQPQVAAALRPRGTDVAIGLILGTGVGGGVVVSTAAGPGTPARQECLSGTAGRAGELGHTEMSRAALAAMPFAAAGQACGCGRRGCADRYFSGGGMRTLWAAYVRHREAQGRPVALTERLRLDSAESNCIAFEFREGHADAVDFVRAFCRALAIFVEQTMVYVLDPAAVVLGGGLGYNFAELSGLVHDALAERMAAPPAVLTGCCGETAGGLGAALLGK